MTLQQTRKPADLHPDRIELLHPKVVEVLRRKTPAERVQAASDMHRAARTMLTSHLRSLHPDWDDQQVLAEVRRRLLGGTN